MFVGWLQRWAEIRDVKQSNLALGMGHESNDGMMEQWDDGMMELWNDEMLKC